MNQVKQVGEVGRVGQVALAAFALLTLPVLAHAQAKDWPSEKPPQPLAARDVKFPPYEIRTLPNGMQVVVVEHHE